MDAETRQETSTGSAGDQLFLVGIGASAGGLEAISDLLKNAPKQVPAAYVIAQHMSPHHKSLLSTLIGRETHLEVLDIEEAMVPQANKVYVTPPKHDVVMDGGAIRLLPPPESAGAPKPSVDRLFRSLAEEYGSHAIGIILSGTGSDGSYGVTAIHDAGGLTAVQHPDTAKYDGMPSAAIKTGCVDLIMATEEIGQALARLPGDMRSFQPISHDDDRGDLMEDLLKLVLTRTSVDFRDYKITTVERRIERRMAANALTTLAEYVLRCRESITEVDALFNDLLISVTRFFRDALEFEALRPHIDALVENHSREEPIRVWVAGCATGEEAYSIAVLIGEAMGGYHMLEKTNVQIFATDLDGEALAWARNARYPLAARADIPEEFFDRYFRVEGDSITVRRGVRDVVLFTQHNVFSDPAFLHMDLVCCRNVLIYFGNDLQDRTLSQFHVSLKPEGLLFLGKSETVTVSRDLFRPASSELNLYRRRQVNNLDYDTRRRVGRPLIPDSPASQTQKRERNQQSDADAAMFAGLARGIGPSVVLFNSRCQIVRVFGEVQRFLTLRESGTPAMDYTLLVDPLGAEARMLVTTAMRTGTRQRGGIRKMPGSDDEGVQLEAIPVIRETPDDFHVLVNLATFPMSRSSDEDEPSESSGEEITALQRELDATNAVLIQTVEDLRASNEELQSTGEEMQATNEELVAMNEELETANEELQSTNEELVTVNEELQITTSQLSEVTDQQEAMLSHFGVPALIILPQLTVAKASKAAHTYFDLPLPLGNVHLSQCSLPDGFPPLKPLIEDVLAGGDAITREIETPGEHTVLNIAPILSERGAIMGATLIVAPSRRAQVLATELGEALRVLTARNEQLEMVARLAGTTYWSIDLTTQALFWSRGVFEIHGLDPDGEPPALEDAINFYHEDDRARVQALVNAAIRNGEPFEFEANLVQAGGAMVPVYAQGEVKMDDKGDARFVVGVFHRVG